MATERKATRRASTAKASAAKASTAKASTETENTEEDEAAKAAEAAEAEAAEAARAEGLADLKGKLSDTLHEIATADKDNAIAVRLSWVEVGRLLHDGKQMFLSGNNVNDKAFGAWLAKSGLKAVGQRPTRAAALWLYAVHTHQPDLYALFPTENDNGEPLRRSPRTLKDWVRDQVHATFQAAFDKGDEELAIPAEIDGEDAKAKAATETVKNVFAFIDKEHATQSEHVDVLHERVSKAKSKADRETAMAIYSDAADTLASLETARDVLNALTDDQRLNYIAAWKPRISAIPFKEMTDAEAAERVFALLKTHPRFSAVYAELGALVEAMQAKVDSEAAEKAKAEAEAANEAGEADFDADEAEADDFDADDFDADEAEADDFDAEDDAEDEADETEDDETEDA